MMPLDSNQRYGILGTQGSGKSNTTWVLVQRLRESGRPVVILDHKGEYSGLTGFMNYRAAQLPPKTLPLRLRTSNVSIVIDLRGQESPAAWVRDFVNACIRLPRKIPLLIVIEESHNYVPQKGKAAGCRQAINNLASEGRSMGYGLVLISQRCSKIDKDALTQCDALYIHRHHFKTDLDYLEEFIGRDRRSIVEGLPTGEALHLDMKGGYIFSRFTMPLAKKKTVGTTPEPAAASPDYQAFYNPLPHQYPRGQNYDYKGSSGGLVIIVIIVLALTFFLAYMAVKGSKDEPTGYEHLTEETKDAGGMPF